MSDLKQLVSVLFACCQHFAAQDSFPLITVTHSSKRLYDLQVLSELAMESPAGAGHPMQSYTSVAPPVDMQLWQLEMDWQGILLQDTV